MKSLALLRLYGLALGLLLPGLTAAQKRLPEVAPDPHRPACTTAACAKMKSFVKKHYCGISPFGNGSEESCDLRAPPKQVGKLAVLADWQCDWNETRICTQKGQPPAQMRELAMRELHRLGLPRDWPGSVYFTVWNAAPSGWTVVEASASTIFSDEESLCQVILLVRRDGEVVLRDVPYRTADVDRNDLTTWSPVDVVDIDGDGQPEVVLEGDAYEDHWLEVIHLRHGKAETIFSGLGYRL